MNNELKLVTKPCIYQEIWEYKNKKGGRKVYNNFLLKNSGNSQIEQIGNICSK